MEQNLGSSSKDILAKPVQGGWALTTRQREVLDLTSTIPGWGSDLDPSVRPGVPMDPAPHLGPENLYPDFEQQVSRHLVHKSIEHAKMTPVFGNVSPPRGLSGMLRTFAFKFSEGRLSHWLMLVLADRVDMFEEIFVDLSKGNVPNLAKEMGLAAHWKYDRKGVIKTAAVVGLSTAAILLLLNHSHNQNKKRIW